MGVFYQVQLRRFPNDSGFTGQSRELTKLGNNGLNSQQREEARKKSIAGGLFSDSEGSSRVSEVVTFEVSPVVSESRSAQYVDEGLPGANGIVVYTVTGNRRYSINAKFVSRTVNEAVQNNAYVNILRSWMVPLGSGNVGSSKGKPPIIRLNGYKNVFFNIPVVVSELSISYPDDVDYIETDIAMVPIVQTVELSLIESHGQAISGIDISGSASGRLAGEFNIELFKQGILPGYS